MLDASDELYALARRVLLDALTALHEHRDALVVVGAQAVYLRVGEAGIAVAPFTGDADLAFEPAVLGTEPKLEVVLENAGFARAVDDRVGSWLTQRRDSADREIALQVDLLVPAGVAPGPGRRAARLVGHDPLAARIVRGLEGALVDADWLEIHALGPADDRVVAARVAGPAALLAAKTHKLADRAGSERAVAKDALDVLRLLQGVELSDLVSRFETLFRDDRSESCARNSLELLADQFASRAAVGVRLVSEAVATLDDPEVAIESAIVLADDLLRALHPG